MAWSHNPRPASRKPVCAAEGWVDHLPGTAARQPARQAGKPAKEIEQIVPGVLEKYKTKHALLHQPYLRDESITIAQLLNQVSRSTGENIVIRRFVRWEINPDVVGAGML